VGIDRASKIDYIGYTFTKNKTKKHMINLDNADLVCSVDLTNLTYQELPVCHALYASQLYGTFFGVFGQFKTEPKKKNGKKVLVIKSLEFDILNYSGTVNIGFSTRVPSYANIDEIPTIYLGVRAGSEIMTKKILFNDPDFYVEKGVRKRIKIHRYLFPMEGFSIPTGDPSDLQTTPIPAGQMFDAEFYFRTGEYYFGQPSREGMAQVIDGRGKVPQPTTFPSLQCYESVVNLIY
jgi:hypothetical protein